MSNSLDKNNTNQLLNDEIDIKTLIKIIIDGRNFIFSLTGIFSIIAVIYSLSLSNIYQSTALLSPVGDQNSSQAVGNIGGLANLAGLSISSQSANNSTKAVTKMETLSFFEESIMPNIFLPDLMAVNSWDAESNTISYKEGVFNSTNQKWSETPSSQKSFEAFMRKMEVVKSQSTGFVTISFKHQSPYIAKEWTELVVNEINNSFRTKDKLEAETSMNYLNAQMAQTSYTEIKQVVAQLLKQKMQQLALIEANEFYVFSYLDSPAVAEEKIEPSRSSISILGAVLGALLGILIVIIRNYFSEEKTT